jgi:PKD repeat protein
MPSKLTWLLVLVGACTEYNVHDRTDPVDPPVEELPTIGPVAIPGGGTDAKRGDLVQLDGTASYDVDHPDDALTYAWYVSEAPEGATWALDFDDTAQPTFSADTLGTYTISLVVTDADALDSENPAATVVQVVPWEDLEVEVTWNQSVDIDLHVIAPGGAYYQDSDCYFANPAPEWGVVGDITDNPLLDVDDDQGGGPERVVLQRPLDDVYTIMVEYYNDRNEASAASVPTLVVRAEGQEVARVVGPTLSGEGRVWIAGTLDWSTLVYTEDDTLTTHASLGGPTYNED